MEAIETCVKHQVPLLGVCRGLQEINVYFGGTLYQDLYSSGFFNHKEDESIPLDSQYLAHQTIYVKKDGWLHKLFECEAVTVNSLHAQGVNYLGAGLEIEGRSEDGLVEAVSFKDHILAVQWHPEWFFESDKISSLIWKELYRMCS